MLAFYTLLGGILGWMHAIGLLDLVFAATSDNVRSQRRHMEAASEFISKEEYERRVANGWKFGCGFGAAIGLVMVVRRARSEA